MNPQSTSKIIFAYKHNGDFYPERIIGDWEEERADLEYDDVVKGNYQLWEYPDGVIWSVLSDRILETNQGEFTTPFGNKGQKWTPVLENIGIDKDKVALAYISLDKS